MQSLVHEGYNLKAICRKSVKKFCKKVEKSNKANVKKVNGKKENMLYGLEMKNDNSSYTKQKKSTIMFSLFGLKLINNEYECLNTLNTTHYIKWEI